MVLLCMVAAMVAVTGGASAERYLVMGHTGDVIPLGELEKSTAEQLESAKVLESPNITFTIEYQDPPGLGFNDEEQGADRREVLENVLAYINTVIFAPGGRCDVRVRPSTFTGTGFLAVAGTLFDTSLNFTNGAAYEHITTGIDPFMSDPDIFTTFNFGYTWNSTMNPPASGHYDLFSVLLHEMGHGLGMMSLTNGEGESLLTGGATFTGWDNLLYTSPEGTKLWDSETTTFLGEGLAGGNNSIRFHGKQAQAAFPDNLFPPVHPPTSYQLGTSISHWQNVSGIPAEAVMRPFIFSGIARREYQLFEIGALNDLGYIVFADLGGWMLY